MPSNLDRYKKDLTRLLEIGRGMQLDLETRNKDLAELEEKLSQAVKKIRGTFEPEYQSWYTEASAVIRQLIPDRLQEFVELYKGDSKRKQTDLQTYHIQDWLNGLRASANVRTGKKHFEDLAVVSMRFGTQLAILEAVKGRFESSLYDIRQLVQADMLDSELDAALTLASAGFSRAAGAVAGVVLEKHLGQVVMNHSVSTKKQHPSITDFNDLLKSAGVVDVPAWRNIQRLGDLRNLCDHNKHRDPTAEEIQELINGVEKVTKTLF